MNEGGNSGAGTNGIGIFYDVSDDRRESSREFFAVPASNCENAIGYY